MRRDGDGVGRVAVLGLDRQRRALLGDLRDLARGDVAEELASSRWWSGVELDEIHVNSSAAVPDDEDQHHDAVPEELRVQEGSLRV